MKLPIKVQLPANFLEAEIREGYEVTVKQKKIWAVELDLLNELMDVCKKHGIKFQVFAGTLLGAVRHKGFIPWDDDLDVAITRDEYNKLLAVSAEFKSPYFLQTALSDRRYFCPYARLRNSETTAVIKGMVDPTYNSGIYIDIFVLDGCALHSLLFKFQHALRLVVRKLLTVYYQKEPRDSSMLERLLRVTRLLARMFPYAVWYSMYLKIITMFDKSSVLAFLSHTTWDRSRHWVYRKETDELIELPFENLRVPVSKFYPEILSRNYHNYMSFPPAELRGKWHEGKIHFEPDVPYKEYFARKKILDDDCHDAE